MATVVLDSRGQPWSSVGQATEPAELTEEVMRLVVSLVEDEVSMRVSAAADKGEGRTSVDDLDTSDHEQLVKASRRAYYKNPLARNAVEALRLFVCGGGWSVLAFDQDPDTQAFIDDYGRRNKMRRRINEACRRLLRDGGVAIRRLPRIRGNALRFMDIMRFKPNFDPSDLRSDSLAYSTGIVTDPDDIETIIEYWYDTDGDGRGDLRIEPDEIYYVKLFADSDMLSGRPLVEPVLRRLGQYEQWVDQRALLNRLRSSIYLKRTVRGSAAMVTQAVSKTVMSERTGRTDLAKMPAPGTILTTTDNVDYELMSANLEARDAVEDGRRIVLDVSAGLGMPLPLLTGDVSETTYAGLLVAESPFVRRAQDCQHMLADELIVPIYEDVLREAIDAGELPEKSERSELTPEARAMIGTFELEIRDARGDDRRTKRSRAEIARLRSTPSSYTTKVVERDSRVMVRWPDIVHRNFKDTAEALAIVDSIQIASRSTMAAMLGFSWEDERRKLESERVPRVGELDRIEAEFDIGDDDDEEEEG